MIFLNRNDVIFLSCKRIFSLLCCLLLTLTMLSGCDKDGAGEIIVYDVPNQVINLDPQFTTDETARMIIYNTFDGLLRQTSDGNLVPCIAERYMVSDDGLTYTFFLRQDAVWSDGVKADSIIPITAHDFVFAFHRIFSSTMPSPYASSYLSLKNGRAVLRGGMAAEALGVHALDDFTLVFTLEQPDGRLPELLASTAAMPCNEEFFRSTRARYGMDLENLRFNGAFYMRNWDNEKGLLSLRLNQQYVLRDEVTAAGVDLYLLPAQEGDAKTRFLKGMTDVCRVDYQTAQAVLEEGGNSAAFEDTVWVLALNTKNPQLANTDLRRAIGYALNRQPISARIPENLRLTSVFIPPAIGSVGHSYRSFAGEGSPVAYSPELSKRALQQALAELGVDQPALKEILVCAEMPHPLLAGFVQQNLQALSISTGLVQLPREELLRRVNEGDYTMAILPMSASYSSANALLSQFYSDAATNFTGYRNPAFDRLLDAAAGASGDEQYNYFRQAEQLLLAECAAMPLYFETTYYAMAKGVSDIHFSPFLSGTDFRDARKR